MGPSINYVTPKGVGGSEQALLLDFSLQSIRFLTESVTWGRGSKIANFGVT